MRADSSALTSRELEVARLVAQGMTNQQIADGLGISLRTVRTHIETIMDKLDVDNRVKVALWAIRNGVAA